MKTGVMNKMKIFVVITLALLVAGMTLFGIFGFNQTVDYKKSYEMQVSIDQAVEKSMATMETAADGYLETAGLKDVSYAFQKMGEGKVLVYKFKSDVSSSAAAMKAAVQKALTDAGNAGTVDVVVYEVKEDVSFDIVWLIVGLAVGVVVICGYVLIMEKLAAALATSFAAVLSALLFVALMGLTRLPAYPFVGAACAFAMVLAAALSAVSVNKLNGALKDDPKASTKQIADKLACGEKTRCIVVSAAVAVAAVALAVLGLFGMPYALFVGAQLLIAGVVGTFAAYFGTPFIWTAVKAKKNKKS